MARGMADTWRLHSHLSLCFCSLLCFPYWHRAKVIWITPHAGVFLPAPGLTWGSHLWYLHKLQGCSSSRSSSHSMCKSFLPFFRNSFPVNLRRGLFASWCRDTVLLRAAFCKPPVSRQCSSDTSECSVTSSGDIPFTPTGLKAGVVHDCGLAQACPKQMAARILLGWMPLLGHWKYLWQGEWVASAEVFGSV